MTDEIFHFRVLLDYKDEVFRDILISSEDTFESLHEAIVNAFGFSGMEMASFYLSNDEWDKGEEITRMDMGQGENGAMRIMDQTVLNDLLSERGDKMLYVYDFMKMWIFYVELIDRLSPQGEHSYPTVSLVVGDAPDEGEKDPIDAFPSDFDDEIERTENIDEIDDLED
jgi:hypothetical protein